ncbi:MAG: cation acetate symporter [Nitrospirae bacterium GWC2_57_13]|jgi:cation/acetate symporter|nr:MAG: cation acetate symporter [Nitrospirae bacterium GWC1_57_7]OGW28346.1 MAG: cation acetate symporter [Nitrospirae bacterium GWC2_57_13]HAR46505.1 cation acetate symporter [Nitrospiraceae bacterium]HAS55081.1 cation acetate symporter [Nitrospiraceae bacterium]
MSILAWTWIIVGLSFALYIGIAIWAKAKTTGDFYVAAKQVHPVLNGMATGADWMSAASFISMAGMIAFLGRDGAMYLMGWTGGYVLLAMLLAPYLRKYGKYTVPMFVGERYYSQSARVVAVMCAIFVSFTYVAGQMRGVGVVFSRFLEVDINVGVMFGMAIVFFYAVLGGMKGITYTQVAQYCVLIIAYLIPAIFISIMLTGNPVPQLGYGSSLSENGMALLGTDGGYLLDKLNGLHQELGLAAYTGRGGQSMIDVFMITFALMVGTAGLPHIIIRFFTTPTIKGARSSAGWALLFIAILYTTAPAVAAFAKLNLIRTVQNKTYAEAPSWFKNWEKTGLLAWKDKNNDGKIQFAKGEAFKGKIAFAKDEAGKVMTGKFGERVVSTPVVDSANELYIDRDIMVLANPEIAKLPAWVIALVAAGGLAAALSTAAGLLLVIASAVSHDLIKNVMAPNTTEKAELMYARIAAGGAVLVAGYFGIHPPGFVAQVVAFAFGLAASSFFPVIIMGIFWKRATKEGAMLGMISGILFTAAYIIYFKFVNPSANVAQNWLWGISPEGIGTIGMVINFVVMYGVSKFTKEPPQHVQDMVGSLRFPRDVK